MKLASRDSYMKAQIFKKLDLVKISKILHGLCSIADNDGVWNSMTEEQKEMYQEALRLMTKIEDGI